MQISANHLKIGYDDKIVVPDFDVVIHKHDITTFIGPNGCGKSTILKALTRILKCGGVIEIDGNSIHTMPTKEVAKKIAILSQQQTMPPDITVEELVGFGRMPYQKFLQRLSDDDKKIVDWAMEATSVSHMRKRSIFALSGGEKQRVWISVALAQKPEMLFLDEPTTYLDIQHQIEIMELVQKLNTETGIGIVMVLHDISQALEVSSQVVVIKDGKKYAHGTPQEVITPEMLRDVYGVESRIIPIEGRRCPIICYDGLCHIN